MAITVYFVRHGETYFNCFARLQGWADTPLTKKGEQDAVQVGKALSSLHIDYLFASDLKRAVDTAKIMVAQIPGAKVKTPVQKNSFARPSTVHLKATLTRRGLSGPVIWAASDSAGLAN